MSYGTVITGEVTKMLKVETNMAVIGHLEGVLSIAMEMLPPQKADWILRVHFTDREPLPPVEK